MQKKYLYMYMFFLSYIYTYIHYRSKVFGHPQELLFLILKELFQMNQIKHNQGFIYYTKCKPPSFTLPLVHAKQRGTARPSTDALAGLISGVKSHWTGVRWSRPKTTYKCGSLLAILPLVFGWKNTKNLWSSDCGQKGHFDESKVKEFFGVFCLICV